MAKTKITKLPTIEIKHWYTGTIIHAGKYASIADAVKGAIEAGANLAGADLAGADLTRANLTGTYLARANLTGADLAGANLTRADLTRANLARADLTRANLTGADLTGANLAGANLARANLTGADLTGANLAGANLTRANLTRANLTGTYLAGANLTGANLTRANGINPYLCQPLYILRDQPGKIRAYKIVTANGEGIYARHNGYTPFNYDASSVFSEPNANTDPDEECGAGIHLATLDWCMREWREGYRILVMEFTAKDIACIPTLGGGKFRVYRCKRVGEKDLVELGLVKKED